MPSGRRLPRSFFDRPSLEVAPDLLGCLISAGPVTSRLTEVEAYAGTDDPGSHAFRGLTPRTEVMFGKPGHLYVYFTYGMHWCANIVCGPAGTAAAVLLRAGEIVTGEDAARRDRHHLRVRDLARGPARLATALGLDGTHNGLDLCAPSAEVSARRAAPTANQNLIRMGPRVGVSGPGGDAAAYPWRFWLDGEPTVSTYRPGRPSRADRHTRSS